VVQFPVESYQRLGIQLESEIDGTRDFLIERDMLRESRSPMGTLNASEAPTQLNEN